MLIEALQGDSNFSKITGEVGTGKTMLCRMVLNSLEAHKDKYVTAYIPHPILSEEGIMHALAEELAINPDTNISYYELLKLVTQELLRISANDKSVVLFIDEAQAMPEETLEALRLLTTADSKHGNHLQVILFGQGELDELLEQPILRELKRNLSFEFELPALDRGGLEAYVEHRLVKAGYNGSHMFTEIALDLLLEGSRGIPRVINILAHKSLLVAYGKNQHVIDKIHILAAIRDTEFASTPKNIR